MNKIIKEVPFEIIDTIRNEFNVLVATVNGLINAIEIRPGTDEDQIATGVQLQMTRVNDLIESMFDHLPESDKQKAISKLILLGYKEKQVKDAMEHFEQTLSDKPATVDEWLKKTLGIL